MAQEKTNNPLCLTRNKDMKDLITKVRQVAQTGCSAVLITGENGTGKEAIARLLHHYGPRNDKPMVPVNCGAIPAALAKSEFFGHKKKGFTGTDEQRASCCEQAEGGTLFLDEIGEMPRSMQVKLLRIIELGGTLRDVEQKEGINQTLNSADNNKTEAAQIWGVTRNTLQNRVDSDKEV